MSTYSRESGRGSPRRSNARCTDCSRAAVLQFCRSVQKRAQQVSMAGFHHPTGARQMAVMDQARTFRLTRRIETEDDPHGFAPIGTLLRSVQQADVCREMPLVIGRELRAVGWAIVESRYAHGQVRFTCTMPNATPVGGLPQHCPYCRCELAIACINWCITSRLLHLWFVQNALSRRIAYAAPSTSIFR